MKLQLVLIIALLEIVSIFGCPSGNHTEEMHHHIAIVKTYHIDPFVKTNWFRAIAYCNSIGMRLVNIYSEEENEKIVKMVNDSGYGNYDFWTSATNFGHTRWYWLGNGNNMVFNNWGYYMGGQQPDKEDEHCVLLYHMDNFRWHDFPCTDDNHVICEKSSEYLTSTCL
ncbi:perlucin-like protein [Sitodiplosis mosellana]|uniref:perlucin-like protein n=1 Tax=Sitodiplosis mosellana TaxID=263140 RepID=UPI002443E72E|nr:perlucin-like protein [Sitodiplosis mosellana]XP_055313529.1 perlucin-like protein [Sitodiplosis mosellana]XP_055313530.1 perlucin-like protein [Sitodiplosis mosellana]